MGFEGASDAELLDMLATTLEAYPLRGHITTLLKYQNHVALEKLLEGRQDVTKEMTGKSIDWRVAVKNSGAAKQTQPYAVDAPSVSPVVKNASVGWTHHQTNWTVERTEMLMNMGSKVQLHDLVKVRRNDGLISSADLIEQLIWDVPNTTADTLNPKGVPYWLVPITGAQVTAQASDANVEKFRGGNPLAADGNSFSDAGGIDCTDADNVLWKSYNDVWGNAVGNIEESDLDKIRSAFRKQAFTSPVTMKDLEMGPARLIRFYMGDTLLTQFERQARAQNDQLGADVGKFQGMTVFKRIPLEYVAFLDTYDDSSNTVFGQYPLVAINWDMLLFATLKGATYREGRPMDGGIQQHLVFTTFVDLSYNMYCRDRRRAGFVISHVAAG